MAELRTALIRERIISAFCDQESMIIEARHPEGIPLRLSEDNALTAVLAELDAQEYPTRMGVSVEDSRQMRNMLDALTGQMRLVKTA
jgi:hypothetical protein